MKRLVPVVLALVTAGSLADRLRAQSGATEPERTPVLQNETVAVTRLRFGPGARESVHTHPFPLVLIQMTSGDIAVQEQSTTKRGGRVGEVWYVPADRPHAITRLSNEPAIDVIAVAVLPNRPTAPAAPPTEAPQGINRATLVDNENVRVVRVGFSPGSREPVHTHPNDLLTIQLTRGKLDMQIGADHNRQSVEPGLVKFLPRNVPHAYISEDTKPFELISLSVK